MMSDDSELSKVLAELQAAKNEIPDPPPTPKTFSLVPFADMVREPAPIRWLIKGWLQREALQMLHGAPGAGKSFVCLDWAMHVATDATTWAEAADLDRPGCTVRGGNVVYLTGEGHNGIKKRLAAWAVHNQTERANIAFSETAEALNTEEGYETVREAIKATGQQPALVIVDTLHNHNQGDENSSKDAWGLINNCRRLIQEFKCTVLLVHHTGLFDQERARGSSAYKAAIDLEISCKKSGGLITLEQKKNKEEELSPSLHFELQKVLIPGWIDEDGQEVTSAVICPSGSKPEQTKRKSQNVMTAIKAYEDALKEDPQVDTEGNLLGVHVDTWRTQFYNRSTSDSIESKKKGFQNARRYLIESTGEFSKNGDIYKRMNDETMDNLIAFNNGKREKAGKNGKNFPLTNWNDTGKGREKTLGSFPAVPDSNELENYKKMHEAFIQAEAANPDGVSNRHWLNAYQKLMEMNRSNNDSNDSMNHSLNAQFNQLKKELLTAGEYKSTGRGKGAVIERQVAV